MQIASLPAERSQNIARTRVQLRQGGICTCHPETNHHSWSVNPPRANCREWLVLQKSTRSWIKWHFLAEKCTFLEKKAFSYRKIHIPAAKCGIREGTWQETGSNYRFGAQESRALASFHKNMSAHVCEDRNRAGSESKEHKLLEHPRPCFDWNIVGQPRQTESCQNVQRVSKHLRKLPRAATKTIFSPHRRFLRTVAAEYYRVNLFEPEVCICNGNSLKFKERVCICNEGFPPTCPQICLCNWNSFF